jgi:heme o synthase
MGYAGIVYTVIAAVSGGWFIYESHVLYREARREHTPQDMNKKAMKVFHISITYLTLVFVALAIDPFVGAPLFQR